MYCTTLNNSETVKFCEIQDSPKYICNIHINFCVEINTFSSSVSSPGIRKMLATIVPTINKSE